MAEDDDRPLRLVAQNDDSAIEAQREEALAEKVRVSFATAVANVLDFLTGAPPRSDMIEAMRAFLAVADAADKQTSDPKGARIRIPDIEPRKPGEPDIDAAINTITRARALLDVHGVQHAIALPRDCIDLDRVVAQIPKVSGFETPAAPIGETIGEARAGTASVA